MKIDGKAIAEQIAHNLKENVQTLKQKNIIPHLAIILVGDDPASAAYVKRKVIKAEEIGAKATVLRFNTNITNEQLKKTIEQLNNDNNIHGVIIQRPLPEHIDLEMVNQTVKPKKDIDAFHPKTPHEMPLAKATMVILQKVWEETKEPKETNEELQTSGPSGSFDPFVSWLSSKNIVIIGKGETGGGPIIHLLKSKGLNPNVIDSKTANPKDITKQADIIISAVGRSNVVTADMLKKGVILLSVGLHKEADGKLHGDYEENEIKDIASFYTPTPGGVGPVNVICLLDNLIQAAS